jgi:hypothetical protein
MRLKWTFAPRAEISDVNGDPITARNGYVGGLTPPELFSYAALAREGLRKVSGSFEGMVIDRQRSSAPESFHVLSRAMRSRHPGFVFARAAANGEVDPLTDVTSRLFVGLAP